VPQAGVVELDNGDAGEFDAMLHQSIGEDIERTAAVRNLTGKVLAVAGPTSPLRRSTPPSVGIASNDQWSMPAKSIVPPSRGASHRDPPLCVHD
jgi:hypothetical protein